MGRQTLALLAQLDAACQACDDLASDTEELFLQHPDAEIITSFPGLATLTGARILAEIGDDRARFTHADNLKAFAGSAPVTRQSGKGRHVAHRRIKNSRLAATGRQWAFTALTASPGAHGHYNRRRDTGDHLCTAGCRISLGQECAEAVPLREAVHEVRARALNSQAAMANA